MRLRLPVAAVAERESLAEVNRRAWTRLVGGRGDRVARGARIVWLVWGAVTALACAAALAVALAAALT